MVQFGAALIAISFDIIVERVTLPVFGYTIFPLWITYPLTIFWVMGMINTVNWLDGLDGLAAGVAAIASLLFAVHAYSLGQTAVALFPLALTAACLGFLPFNFPRLASLWAVAQHAVGFAWLLSLFGSGQACHSSACLGIPILISPGTFSAGRQQGLSNMWPGAIIYIIACWTLADPATDGNLYLPSAPFLAY